MLEIISMKFLVLGLFLCSFSAVAADDICADHVNDCEYYTCVAVSKNCSNRTYPIRFARRYCLRYEARNERFSQMGQEWVSNVRSCLIREMNTYVDELTCGELKNRAFKDHVPCYIESGFCSLSNQDRKQILKTIWPSLKNIKVILSGIETYKSCLGKSLE
jgi:hypothetical protein